MSISPLMPVYPRCGVRPVRGIDHIMRDGVNPLIGTIGTEQAPVFIRRAFQNL